MPLTRSATLTMWALAIPPVARRTPRDEVTVAFTACSLMHQAVGGAPATYRPDQTNGRRP